jgi:hypothetical protein
MAAFKNQFEIGFVVGKRDALERWKRLKPKTIDQIRVFTDMINQHCDIAHKPRSPSWKAGYKSGAYAETVNQQNKLREIEFSKIIAKQRKP